MEFSLSYPVRPHAVSRGWGVTDSQYQKFGFTRHNGIDIPLAEGTEIRAPFEGTVTLVGNQPKGSGIFLCFLSKEKYDFPDGKRARVELTLMHLSETLIEEGARVSAGQAIAKGGHTGLSATSHVHISPKRVKFGILGYRDLDRNDADNTFDPEPYWDGSYA